MKRSSDRILTTHPGRLPNPQNYTEIEIFKNDYEAVIDAGFTLQIHDPALCTRNTVVDLPMDRAAYRIDCEARIEAANWA